MSSYVYEIELLSGTELLYPELLPLDQSDLDTRHTNVPNNDLK